MNQYFIVYKPFNVLSQFTSEKDKKCLKDFFDVPQDVYPVGRLDYDSEGLLILTNDKKLNSLLLNPLQAHEREYWVQVEGTITHQAIDTLKNGVDINVNGVVYKTKNCKASIIESEPKVPPRNPPIRFRKSVTDSWIRLVLTEGKNRQVRKMTAHVGFPTLRLIRSRIEKVKLEKLNPGEMKIISPAELYNLLQIKK
ncbi:MAG: pseudouridine synthase [Ginsengibacter sp.]